MVATEFILVLFLAGFGLVAGLPMILLPLLFAPKKPNPIKSETFESGQVPAGESKVHLIMQYYAYLIMFVVFDVIVMFLFVFGVSFLNLGLLSALPMISFLAIIFVPMGYALHLARNREIW